MGDTAAFVISIAVGSLGTLLLGILLIWYLGRPPS